MLCTHIHRVEALAVVHLFVLLRVQRHQFVASGRKSTLQLHSPPPPLTSPTIVQGEKRPDTTSGPLAVNET
jgi:hypothetical protein